MLELWSLLLIHLANIKPEDPWLRVGVQTRGVGPKLTVAKPELLMQLTISVCHPTTIETALKHKLDTVPSMLVLNTETVVTKPLLNMHTKEQLKATFAMLSMRSKTNLKTVLSAASISTNCKKKSFCKRPTTKVGRDYFKNMACTTNKVYGVCCQNNVADPGGKNGYLCFNCGPNYLVSVV